MADDNDKDDASEQRRQKLVKAGVAVGIGSAAIVAAGNTRLFALEIQVGVSSMTPSTF